MSGTLYGLSLSQHCDESGTPLTGGKLYLYEANTNVPVVAYQTLSLTPGEEHPWPIVLDNKGRIPAFWLPLGAYRARLTDANDVVQFDDQNIETLYAGTSDPAAYEEEEYEGFLIGDIKFRLGEEALTGWVMLNGQTLGNAGSGAAVEGAAYEALYTYFWNNFDDTICPVAGGRFTAANDFAAGKTLGMLDMRGRVVIGLDDMGAAAANRLADFSFSPGDATTGGSAGGTIAAGSPGLGFLLGTWYIKA